VSSSQIFIANNDDLPLADSGPVSDIPKPILIGSAARAGAGARRLTAAAESPDNSAMPKQL
jgi:hypothetical protein